MSANGHAMTGATTGTNTAAPINGDAHNNGYANGNGNGHHSSFDHEKSAMAHKAPVYNGGHGQSNHLSRTLTPGGHFADDDLIAIANSHRKIGNPLPLGGKLLIPYLVYA